MAKEVKKDIKTPVKDTRQKMNFAFGRKNYMFLLIGILLLIIGYVTLSGGGSKDPNVFSYALFSTQRMVTAPIILFLGYCTIAYAIMIRPKAEEQNENQQ